MKDVGNGFHAIQKHASFVLRIVCILSLATLTHAQKQGSYKSTSQLTGVAAVEAYCKSLDAFGKRTPRRARIFGNSVSPNQETYPVPPNARRYWDEYPNREARESAPKGYDQYDGAEVWMRNGKVVMVQFEPDRYFGAAEQVVTYYFREDGSLAKTRNKFYDLGVDGDVVKETIYDDKGRVLQTRMQCVHVARGGRRTVVNCSRMLESDHDAPGYRKVQELPFIDLLKDQS